MIHFTLFSIINKNLKIFFRSKISSISIILIPLLIILFAGTAFDSSKLSNVQIGVYSETPESTQTNIIQEFENNNFTTKEYLTQDGCINSVKLSKSQLCVSFESNDKITFHVDDSRINLADLLINNVKSSATKEAANIGGVLVQELIDTLQSTKNNLPEKKKNLENTINIAEQNKHYISGLSVSNTNADNIETDLEEAKKTVNNTNTKEKIEKALITITELKKENEVLSEKISSATDNQEDLIRELEKNSKEIEEMISKLDERQATSAQKIISPFDINVKPINSNSKKRDNLIPTLLALIALFGATLLSSTLVMKAKKSKAYFRNFITPVKDITFLLGTYFTCLIILLIQFLMVLAGIKFILNINIFNLPLELVLAIITSLTVFIFIGMLLGYLFHSEETIIFSSVIFSTILMFFSNTILPLENISKSLMKFASFNPLVISESLFKKIILFNIEFANISKEFIYMGILTASLLILTYIFRRVTRRSL